MGVVKSVSLKKPHIRDDAADGTDKHDHGENLRQNTEQTVRYVFGSMIGNRLHS